MPVRLEIGRMEVYVCVTFGSLQYLGTTIICLFIYLFIRDVCTVVLLTQHRLTIINLIVYVL